MTLRSISIFALLIAPLFTFSQSKIEIEARDFFWGASDIYKNVTEIPEKWKNESAVIIYKNVNYDFHKFGKKVTYKNSIRKRIKLLDKAAVEEFSDFSFKKNFYSRKGYSFKVGQNIIGIKIIKPDGTAIEIDVDEEAVSVKGKSESKVAIPNLEVGDIIDYFYYSYEPFKTAFARSFDAVETTLSEEYPIMDFKLFFETENDFFINFKSFNGAPELKQIPTDKKNFRRYELIAKNIEKYKGNKWLYPLVELPSYKFQVYFARSGKFENYVFAYLPEKENIIKTSVSKDEVLELLDGRLKQDKDGIEGLKNFLKGKTFKNDEDKVTKVYYFMRHHYFTRSLEIGYAREAKITAGVTYHSTNTMYLTSRFRFVKLFADFLSDQKIKYDIVVTKSRYDGSMDDLLISGNQVVFLKVNTKNPVYLKLFGPFTDSNEFYYETEGAEAYLLSKSKANSKKIDLVNKETLPISTYQQNESKKEITLTLKDNFSILDFEIINNYKGHQKSYQQDNRLIYCDYVNEDHAKYDTKSALLDKIVKKKHKAQVLQKKEALEAKFRKKQKESHIEMLKEEFNLTDVEDEDYTFTINNTGRYGFETPFTFTERFNTKNVFIKKAGPNYILEVGKLITEQVDLEKDQRKRTTNIYMPYPRSYTNIIKINIPEGYTAVGLDKFNKSIDNETGAFISTAKIENNQLIVTTSKQYKHNYEPKENWPLMIAFLDEAVQFTNEKVLLKKK